MQNSLVYLNIGIFIAACVVTPGPNKSLDKNTFRNLPGSTMFIIRLLKITYFEGSQISLVALYHFQLHVLLAGDLVKSVRDFCRALGWLKDLERVQNTHEDLHRPEL